MYKPSLILFSFFTLVVPILAVPAPAQQAGSFTGQAKVFTPGSGACGYTNSQDQLVAAIPASPFNNGGQCGQQVNIVAGGKSVQAKVVDKCNDCGSQDIDVSPAAFQQLTGQTSGSTAVTWSFV